MEIEVSIEEKAKRYDEAIEIAKAYKGHDVRCALEEIFPELRESEDEGIRKDCIKYLNWEYQDCPFDGEKMKIKKCIAWLEKQDGQKSDKVEPKLKVGDWCIDNEDGTIFQIVKVLDNTYTYKTNEGKEYSCTHYSLENDARLWTIQDAKDGDILATKDEIFIYNGRLDAIGRVCTHYGIYKTYNELRFTESCFPYKKPYPATKEQRDILFQKMKEAGYEWNVEKRELKKIVEWEPQTGDTFRKKGTTSPTYHLCDKREDGITFGFVENREVGISGGEITIFELRQGYELVERPKTIEDVAEEELNKALQTKVPKLRWSEEDETRLTNTIIMLKEGASHHFVGDDITKAVYWLKNLKKTILNFRI